MLFGMGFCVFNLLMQDDGRFFVSLLGEGLSFGVWLWVLVGSLKWLYVNRWKYPTGLYDTCVNVQSGIYLAIIAINLANSGTSGIFSKGNKLDFYFQNDWYRRLITFSTVPEFVITYYALLMIFLPIPLASRRKYVTNIALFIAMGFVSGSKGSSILTLCIALAFIWPVERVNWSKRSFPTS